MPLYEYICNNCGEEFEKMIRFTDEEISPVCPKCNSPEIHKKISRVGVFGSSSASTTNSNSSCSSSSGFS